MAAMEMQTSQQAFGMDLLSEANHRIANNLAVLLSTVQLKSAKLAKGPQTIHRDDAREMLHDIASKITSVGHLHRHLSNMPGASDIDAGNFLIESSAAIVASLALKDRIGIVQRLSTRCRIKADQAQPLGLILSEVITNAVKYSHPAQGVPIQIHIECIPSKDGGIEIEIGDDGVGLPESFDTAKDGGTGFRLICALASNLGAALKIETNSLGLAFRLHIPPGAPLRSAANDITG